MSAAGGPKIITEGLTLCVDAADPKSYSGSGATWADRSGNNYDVILNGATFGSSRKGKFGFDGDDYGYIKTVNYGGGNTISELTVLVWARTSETGSNSDDGSFVSTQWAFIDFDRSEVFNFFIEPGGQLKFAGDSSNAGGFTAQYDLGSGSTTLFNDGEWHNLAVTFSVANQEIKFYGDGVLLATKTANGSMTALGSGSNRYGFIGDGSEATTENGDRNLLYFTGDMALLHFYDSKCLSSAEILQNFNASRSRFGV